MIKKEQMESRKVAKVEKEGKAVKAEMQERDQVKLIEANIRQEARND